MDNVLQCGTAKLTRVANARQIALAVVQLVAQRTQVDAAPTLFAPLQTGVRISTLSSGNGRRPRLRAIVQALGHGHLVAAGVVSLVKGTVGGLVVAAKILVSMRSRIDHGRCMTGRNRCPATGKIT